VLNFGKRAHNDCEEDAICEQPIEEMPMSDIKVLRRVVEEIQGGTKAGRLRRLMPEIEKQLADGARLADIANALTSNGLPITPATLKSYLYRHRKAARESVLGENEPRGVFEDYARVENSDAGGDTPADESAGTSAAMTPMLLRHINTVRCLRLLRRGATYSRADLARELGLTRATTGGAIKELIESGLVTETSARLEGPRLGRPGSALCLNSAGAYSIGIEIGTRAVTAVLVDLGMRVIRRVTEIAEYEANDVERAIAQIAHLPGRLLSECDIDESRVQGVGISIPGLVNSSGGVVVAPFLGWHDIPLKQILSARPETRWPITVCNDAVAFAHAERTLASDRDAHNMLVVLLAEGIGGSIVQRGQIFEGAHGFAGEFGHMVMASSPTGDERQTFEALGGYYRFRPFFPEGQPLVESLQWLAKNASRIASRELDAAFDAWADVLTTGMLNLIYLFDPEKIVLGGPLSVLFPRVEANVKKAIAANLLRGYKPPPIFTTQFGADGASIGAAAVVRDQLFLLPSLEQH
jgi:predicted NBD/HSP70 family sugar kinase